MGAGPASGPTLVEHDDDASYDELRRHLQPFIDAHNHTRRLETLRDLAPDELVIQQWIKDPKRLKIVPSNRSLGPNTQGVFKVGYLSFSRACRRRTSEMINLYEDSHKKI